jgi:cyclic-di-GMP-binding protein
MAESSFDVIAEVDRAEVTNAIHQAAKEVTQRFDFKNTDTHVEWAGDQIVITSNSDSRVIAALDVLKEKLVRRQVSLKALEYDEPKPAARGTYRLEIALAHGIPGDKAREMVKLIKASKLKVQVAVQGDQLRVSGKSKDHLQEVQALLRENDQNLPLRFTNYK